MGKTMKEFKYVITDEVGIHARPAGLLVKEAKALASKITIEANGKSADASKLMAVMQLGVKKGQEIVIKAEGDDEDSAIAKIEEFMKANL
jgi:phosphocarrier protein